MHREYQIGRGPLMGAMPALLVHPVLLLVAVMMLLAGQPTHAQMGHQKPIPGPIDTVTLTGYADRLDLSPVQRSAMEPMHGRYLTKFLELQEEQINPYLEERGQGFVMTLNHEEMKESAKTRAAIERAVERLDRQFFNEVQGLLTEEQARLLPRVMQARQRTRHQVGIAMSVQFFSPSQVADLTVILTELELMPRLGTELDGVVETYERALTRQMEVFHSEASQLSQRVADAMIEDGGGLARQNQGEPADAEEQARMDAEVESRINVLFRAMSKAEREIKKSGGEIAALNRRTLKQIIPMLAAEDGERLKQAFLSRVYARAVGPTRTMARRFEMVDADSDLTAEQREQVEALQRGYRVTRDAQYERLLDAVDSLRELGLMINASAEEQAEQTKRQERFDGLVEDQRALVERTSRQLDDIIGEQQATRLAEAIDREQAERPEENTQRRVVMLMETVEVDGSGGAPKVSMRSFTHMMNDEQKSQAELDAAMLPGMMNWRTLVQRAAALELSEAEGTILEAMHADYMDQYQEVRSAALETIREAERPLKPEPGSFGMRDSVGSKEVRELFRAQRNGMRKLGEVDQQFFADIALALGSDERTVGMERLALARTRDRYSGQTAGLSQEAMMGMAVFVIGDSDPGEEVVDLSRCLASIEAPAGLHEQAQAELLDYERAITQMFKDRYERESKIEEASQMVHVSAMERARAEREASGSNEMNVSIDSDDFAAVDEMRAKFAELTGQIVAMNRDALARCETILGDAYGRALSRAYYREAYPSIYEDERALHDVVESIQNLDDLSTGQRSELATIASTYFAEYDTLCMAMISKQRDGQAEAPVDREVRFSGLPGGHQQLDALLFQRDELNEKTRAKLRDLLTEGQRARFTSLEAAS